MRSPPLKSREVIGIAYAVLVLAEAVGIDAGVKGPGLVVPLLLAGVLRGMAAAGVILAVAHHATAAFPKLARPSSRS